MRGLGDESYPEMLLRHRLYLVADEDPSALLTGFRDYFAACNGYSFDGADGEVISMTSRETEIEDPIGEGAFAFSLTQNHPGYPDWYVLAWREGPLISSLALAHFDTGPNPEFFRELNPGLLERLAADVDARIRDLAAKLETATPVPE
jgi:hypothetical protein